MGANDRPLTTVDPVVEQCGLVLVDLLAEGLKEVNESVRPEDLISAAAAILAMRCIEHAGDYDPRQHDFVPGQRVFSEQVNVLLVGEGAPSTITNAAPRSVFGMLFRRIRENGYPAEVFPSLSGIFESFAAKLGNPEDWGRAPLSVGERHLPSVMPIQMEYETRRIVDKLFTPLGESTEQRMVACVVALGEALIRAADVLDAGVGITIALETVNGMAKTAPMTDKHYQEFSQ